MSISSIRGNQNLYRNQNLHTNRNLQKNYQQLASGKKVNSAADNAAGLAIIQKLMAQSNGYEVGGRSGVFPGHDKCGGRRLVKYFGFLTAYAGIEHPGVQYSHLWR